MAVRHPDVDRARRAASVTRAPDGVEEYAAQVVALRAPTPLTASSASIEVGRTRAISRSVASWKMTYGGTPRDRANLEAHRAEALEEIAIDVLPRLGLDTRLCARRALLRPHAAWRAQVRARVRDLSAARALFV